MKCTYNIHTGDAPAVFMIETISPKSCGCVDAPIQYLCVGCMERRFQPGASLRCLMCRKSAGSESVWTNLSSVSRLP